MSQLSVFLTAGNLPPTVPLRFTADSGVAIPALNNLNILGGVGLTTTGSGNTITIDVDGTFGVVSVIGIGNQIIASPTSGNVILSLPTIIIAPGTFQAITSVSSPSYLLTGSGSGTISILPQAAAGTYNFNLPITAGTSGYLLTSAGGVGSPMTWTNPASIGAVSSVTGTTNQIFVSPTTGAVVVSLTNGISVGTTYQPIAPPAGGAIIFGQVGIGTNSPISNTALTVNGSAAIAIASEGTLTTASTNLVGCQFNNLFSPSAATQNFQITCIPTFTSPSGGLSDGVGLYIANIFAGSGTVGTSYGIKCDPGSASGTTVTSAYGAYFWNPGFGGTKTALYADNLALGYTGISPPTNGAIIFGPVGIGTSSVPSTYFVDIVPTTTFTYGLTLFGGLQALGGAQDAIGIFVQPNLYGPNTSTAVDCKGMYIAPHFTAGSVATSAFMGVNIDGAGMSVSGTAPASAYALYVATPSGASTSNAAIYSDNLVLGNSYATTTPPPNGAIIQGNVGIGTTTPAGVLEVNTNGISNFVNNIYSTGTIVTNDVAAIKIDHIFTSSAATSSNLWCIDSTPAWTIQGSRTVSSMFNMRLKNDFTGFGGTSAFAFGLFLDAGVAIGGGGTIGDAYSLYCDTPVYGTNKWCAYFAGNTAIATTGSFSQAFGGGIGVLALGNANTIPAGSPTGGGIIYVTAGALKYKGSSGTVTNVAPAEPHCPVCGSDFSHQWENPEYGGELTICMKCLCDELGQKPYIRWRKHPVKDRFYAYDEPMNIPIPKE